MKGALDVSGTMRGGGRTPERVGNGGCVEVDGLLVVAKVAEEVLTSEVVVLDVALVAAEVAEDVVGAFVDVLSDVAAEVPVLVGADVCAVVAALVVVASVGTLVVVPGGGAGLFAGGAGLTWPRTWGAARMEERRNNVELRTGAISQNSQGLALQC